VSDFCLIDRRISVNVPPDGPDLANVFDTLETVLHVFEHNETYDRLCATPDAP
jgi:hypothetical protein